MHLVSFLFLSKDIIFNDDKEQQGRISTVFDTSTLQLSNEKKISPSTTMHGCLTRKLLTLQCMLLFTRVTPFQQQRLPVLLLRNHIPTFLTLVHRMSTSASSSTTSTTTTTTTTTTVPPTTKSTTMTPKTRTTIHHTKQVPGLQNGMDYIQLGDSDLLVSKICCTFLLYIHVCVCASSLFVCPIGKDCLLRCVRCYFSFD
jgi:hypothetical protein